MEWGGHIIEYGWCPYKKTETGMDSDAFASQEWMAVIRKSLGRMLPSLGGSVVQSDISSPEL